MVLQGRKITVGITGGITAYKAAEIVSWLKASGAEPVSYTHLLICLRKAIDKVSSGSSYSAAANISSFAGTKGNLSIGGGGR